MSQKKNNLKSIKKKQIKKTNKNSEKLLENKKLNLTSFYKIHYKKLLIIPIILFLLSFLSIIFVYNQEYSPFYKDVSLKGGLSAVIDSNLKTNAYDLDSNLQKNFKKNSFQVSQISKNGKNTGYIIDTDLDEEILINFIEKNYNINLEENKNYDSNFISESLADSFFTQAVFAFCFSFCFMSIVVFLYFKEFVPSFAVVLSAIFDIIVTIGVLNLFNFKVSISGIGALLMLVGYSIDTDILLTNRLVKERGDNYFEKTFFAFKTGTLMSFTTLVAGLGAVFLSNSEVIVEMALILVIGLLVDYISTWIQNSSILLWWINKKN